MSNFNLRLPFSPLLLLILAGALAGCRQAEVAEPVRMLIRQGNQQTGRPGAEADLSLRVEVLGPQRAGFLGGKGRRLPTPGVKVRFELLDEDADLEFLTPDLVETDSGGFAETRIRFGQTFGDHYIRASVVGNPRISQTFRVTAGIEKLNDGQETMAGRPLPEPLGLAVFKPDGTPAAGVPVYFRIVNQPGRGAELSSHTAKTNGYGIAETQLTTAPGATGRYEIIAEVASGTKDFTARSISFTAMTLARWRVVIGVLGGLGIFVFGMKIMSEGLRQLAGGKLRAFLHFFTSNRFSAILAGTAITGLMQSSTACTVMVVGFVNAGLLTLQQSIGVIFGANIGTTVTGQMISLNIHELALPAIAVGVGGIMFCRRMRTRNMFQALLGFGLLFLGMQMMSSELRSISSLPSFISIFQLFDCQPNADGLMPLLPVLGAIAIGTAMTVLVQSSSATIGLTIALALSGLINFYTAVPLILGDNIGTTITAILASIGANRRARQAAVAHTLFNLFGAAYMLLLFYVRIDGTPVFLYLVDLVTSGDVFAEVPENIGRHVATAHTLFNVFNVIIFIPFIPLIALGCNFILPVKKEDELVVVPLDSHLLGTPSIALQQAIFALGRMTESAWKLVESATQAFREKNLKQKETLMQQEHSIDEMQKKTIQYLTELTQRPLSESQAEIVPILIHCVNDAERIGDHGVNILELAQQMNEDKLEVSKKADAEIAELLQEIARQAEAVVESLGHEPGDAAVIRALTKQGEINQRVQIAGKSHLKRLEKKKCTVAAGILYTELLGNLERVADHLSNIAERSPEIAEKPWQD